MVQSFRFRHLLILMAIFILILIGIRIYVTGSIMHLFLVWNIFLAWIPYALSGFLEYRATSPQRISSWILFFTWLVFFPNALYLVTDLIHLQDTAGAPIWYDAMLLFTAALLGLMLAFASLYHVERWFQSFVSAGKLAILMPFIMALSAFGVYLGRFDRWNSWDILHDPVALCNSILRYVWNPVDHAYTWGITGLFAVFYYLMYLLSRWMWHGRQSEIES